QLALRPAIAAAAAAGALDRHRLAFDPKIRSRDSSAAIDERELERLPVGQIRKARLLDRRDVDEHVLSAVVADDEAEALLRIEKFDDAFAFADDLGRHRAAAAAAKAAAATAAAAEPSAATAAIAAASAAVSVAAAAAAAESP